MSACNGFVTDKAAYLFTDAVACHPKTFKPIAFLSKVGFFPECGAAFSATGDAMVPSYFGSALAECGLKDFDDLVRQVPAILKNYISVLSKTGHGNIFKNARIAIAGWSPAANAPALYCIQSDDLSLGGARAFEMFPSAKVINPAAAHEGDMSIINMPFDPDRPAQSGLEMMRAQRKQKFGTPHYAIGGWCQMTTVTREGVSTKVLERWPDKIGERISMPIKTPAGGTF